jgi:hypothetical protein
MIQISQCMVALLSGSICWIKTSLLTLSWGKSTVKIITNHVPGLLNAQKVTNHRLWNEVEIRVYPSQQTKLYENIAGLWRWNWPRHHKKDPRHHHHQMLQQANLPEHLKVYTLHPEYQGNKVWSTVNKKCKTHRNRFNVCNKTYNLQLIKYLISELSEERLNLFPK